MVSDLDELGQGTTVPVLAGASWSAACGTGVDVVEGDDMVIARSAPLGGGQAAARGAPRAIRSAVLRTTGAKRYDRDQRSSRQIGRIGSSAPGIKTTLLWRAFPQHSCGVTPNV